MNRKKGPPVNAHIPHPPRWIFCVGLVLLLLVPVNRVWAKGHQVTIKRGDCTIRITAVGPFFHGIGPTGSSFDNAQARADAATVKEAIEKALTDSEDMQTKVDDACTKQDKEIEILVYRNSTEANYANASPGLGLIRVDLGDIEGVGDDLSGISQEAIDTVKSAKLTRSLAHEFDHLRDAPGEDHEDPAGEDAGLKTGPAVDDENNVIAQMDFPVHRRTFYGAITDGIAVSGYLVDTDGDGEVDSSVTWIVPRASKVSGSRSSHDLSVDVLDEISSAWPFISATDQDMDGIADTQDNCPDLVNPQQGPDCVGEEETFSAVHIQEVGYVPLECIVGGEYTPAHEPFCSCDHLHNTVTLLGLEGSFPETEGECGVGCVLSIPQDQFAYTCN